VEYRTEDLLAILSEPSPKCGIVPATNVSQSFKRSHWVSFTFDTGSSPVFQPRISGVEFRVEISPRAI
jgi:hypothetical protein